MLAAELRPLARNVAAGAAEVYDILRQLLTFCVMFRPGRGVRHVAERGRPGQSMPSFLSL
jgi:hypothetical protein